MTDPWLRAWLDALAFSLSGLPAARTPAGAMAYVLYDCHRDGGSLDYPVGGMKALVGEMVASIESSSSGGEVRLKSHVESIDVDPATGKALGVTLRSGEKITCNEGVICNAVSRLFPLLFLLRNIGTEERWGRVESMARETL